MFKDTIGPKIRQLRKERKLTQEELAKSLGYSGKSVISRDEFKEELLALAKQEGVELSDEQLAAISGGCGSNEPRKCPNCGSTNIKEERGYGREASASFECLDCGANWEVR